MPMYGVAKNSEAPMLSRALGSLTRTCASSYISMEEVVCMVIGSLLFEANLRVEWSNEGKQGKDNSAAVNRLQISSIRRHEHSDMLPPFVP